SSPGKHTARISIWRCGSIKQKLRWCQRKEYNSGKTLNFLLMDMHRSGTIELIISAFPKKGGSHERLLQSIVADRCFEPELPVRGHSRPYPESHAGGQGARDPLSSRRE